ncbi:MAG: glucose-6-phosphate isomerase [Halieaceae bacterium]|jgi:glucose-6-phosphate isomerase|nr:glucose-6-phosphate isomerase [Halieaceae bacterium]
MTTSSTPAPFPDYGFQQVLSQRAARDRAGSVEQISRDPDTRRLSLLSAAGWQLDASRHLLQPDSLQSLLEFAHASGVLDEREALFDGSTLNTTEDRPVLHTLLRSNNSHKAVASEFAAVQSTLARMDTWVTGIHSGDHPGYSGQRITDIVNIGIGGSDLGPRMVVEALKPYHRAECRVHFCANVDPDDLHSLLPGLSPETTLFIICSKTLRTEETLYNARRARQWLLDAGVPQSALYKHFLAVSTNLQAAAEFGIPADNILPMWDWVGGRYSLWSAIGWSIAFAIGMDGFRELLAGAREMDAHFRDAPAEQNMPLRLSLLEIWYVNFLHAQVHAVIPYYQHLTRLPAFLQQLSMESNGKRVNHLGESVSYATAPVLWGDVGTNGQHSFHQLLHQGTLLCPVDFIFVTDTGSSVDPEGKRRLLANGLSQARALMVGRNEADSRASLVARGIAADKAAALAPHLVIPGNRPCSTLSTPVLSPAALGALLALYEHKTFFSGRFWQINSFDQWGVELGKAMGAEIYAALNGQIASFDPSTDALIESGDA